MMESRVKIIFSKKGMLRFISHRDLMRMFEKSFRRSGLPVRYSRGFNPRPRFSFPLALSLGVSGLNEVMEVKMSGPVERRSLRDKLKAQLPADLEIKDVTSVEPGQKIRVKAARYEITCGRNLDFMDEGLRQEVGGVQIERKGKKFLLRDFVEDFRAAGNKITFTLKLGETGTPSISEILSELGVTRQISGGFDVIRTELIEGG